MDEVHSVEHAASREEQSFESIKEYLEVIKVSSLALTEMVEHMMLFSKVPIQVTHYHTNASIEAS